VPRDGSSGYAQRRSACAPKGVGGLGHREQGNAQNASPAIDGGA
jgi:hypothetical protein